MIKSIDEVLQFSRRHPNETIRQIIRSDSGYLKDIFVKNENIFFSQECFDEICRLTKGHKDNWERPNNKTESVLHQLKVYGTPYLFDFNNNDLKELNNQRMVKYIDEM